ncbi:tryptophan--tRNA ligase [Halomarina halobia]|uniref:Tryptophan--tRNA ligase n=1 Tax=Halomarina halobia TaxID=3033386 RepID=A0ABD6AAC4_9EURY|nr:tryptophan--tRNA ligase [Halomarina sp. PSR21]
MSEDNERRDGPAGRPSVTGGGSAGRADGASEASLTDGGVSETTLDPWGSSTIDDYRKLFEEFGIEEFEEVLPEVPNPHYLMRRGVIFGHREYRDVLDAMRTDEPAAVLSGFMPTGDPHIGHKLVFDEIIWHQRGGADAYGLIADLEAHAARGLTWDEIDEHARDYLLSLLALGFDPEDGELYRQSTNRAVQDLAFELGAKANFSELQAIYGFDGETDVSHMQSVVTQMADILYPQLAEPKPTVIPVGPDQDPHVRLARDLAARMRFFKVTEAYASFETDDAERALLAEAYEALSEARSASNESNGERSDPRGPAESDGEGEADGDEPVRCEEAAAYVAATFDAPALVESLENAGMEPLRPRVRFLDRNATEEAFEALIGSVEGEKRVYEGHVDAFDLPREEAARLAREVEVEHGGYGFYAPSSIYHRFMTGLTGGKMSSSVPASHISLLDDPEDGYDKVTSATTGGRETAELQRELGGKADECPVYELYAYLLAGDDDEFATRVYDECVGGERLCGDCKEQAARLMREFLADHQEKRREAEELLESLDLELESPRR